MIKEIANHRSIRKYKSSPIDEEVLSDILHSAARASTCGNMQLYSLVVTLDARPNWHRATSIRPWSPRPPAW